MLHIRLLGNFYIAQEETPLTGFHVPRLQALLAYLLLHRQAPQPRHHIAFQFWPDSSEKQAHTNLRKLLFQLRNALPDPDQFLLHDHLTVQWQPTAPYTLDLADLTEGLARARSHTGNPVVSTDQLVLAQVVNLYQGELLPGCLDEWILPVRQQLHSEVMGALEQLVSLSEHQREYRAGIRYAQRLLGLDPLHEAGYRRLMQLHALNGDRAAALHDYHTCANLLQRELGVEPDEETRTLYEQLLGQDGQAAPPAAPAPLAEAPLVGRQGEWATLLGVWRRAQRGGAYFVGLAGEAGIGKTRLAEELLTWASAQGNRVARTRSYEAEGGLAYAPVTEWLRSKRLKPALLKLDKSWLSEIARLLPELLSEQTQLAPPLPLTEAWQRQRFYAALARATLAEKGPLLLLIDDLQWCDHETLAWLRFLLRYDPAARLLVVGAWRSEAVDAAHPLQTLLRDLQNTNQLTHIELTPLTATETVALARHIAVQPLADSAAAQLYHLTEGHPLFVIETVRAQQGEVERLSPLAPRSTLPTKIHSVIQSRLTQLSAPARELAGLAATVGRRFSFAVVAHANQQGEDGLVQALDELWQRRIIREQGTDAYDFSHDRIREVAYGELSQVRRRLLHRRVAEALEALHPANLDEVSGQLAAHYEQAARLPQARDYWQRAATRAAAQFANGEAILYLSKALTLTPTTEQSVRFALLIQREALHELQGDGEQRLADLLAIQQLGQALLAQDATQAGPAIQAAILLGEYYQRAGQPEQTVASLQSAITLAQQHQARALEARAWSVLGDELFHQAKLEAARTALLQALACAAGEGLPTVEARANEYLAAVAMFSGAKAVVIEDYLQQAWTRFRQISDEQGANRILNKLGYLPVAQGEGDYTRALDYYQQGLQLCRKIGYSGGESNILRNLGVLFTYTAEYAQAAQALQAALAADRQRKDLHSQGVALTYQAGLDLNMGDYGRARASLEAALTCLQQTQSNGWICKIWSDSSLLHWLQGEYAAALAAAQQAHTLAQAVGDHRQIGYALTRLGRALLGLQRYAEAATAFQTAYALHRDLEQVNRSLEPLAGLALVALQQGQLAQALTYGEQIFARIQTRPLDQTDEALHIYLGCHGVLVAAADARSVAVGQLARQQLQRRAAALASAEERQRFWSAPFHTTVVTALKEGSTSTS